MRYVVDDIEESPHPEEAKAAVSKDARHPRPENTGLRGGGRPVGSVDPDGGAEGLAD